MTANFNYIKCPKCEHDRNPSTAAKCEICGTSLRKTGLPVGAIGAGLMTLGILGAGFYFLKDKIPGLAAQPVAASSPTTVPASSTSNPIAAPASPSEQATAPSADVNAFISRGERVLLVDASNADKAAAVQAFAAGDFQTAVTKLQAARQTLRSDPETLIYLNNAKLGNTPALTVAAVVQITNRTNAARELLRGMAQAQDEAIQSGVPFKIVIADDANDPERAKAIATALVQDTNVLAVVGCGTSRTSLEAAPIYQQGRLIMISPTSTTTELSKIPKGAIGENYIFRTIPSDQFTGTALARYALAQGKRKAAIYFNSQSSYSKSLMEAFSTTLSLEGGQMVQQIDLSQGSTLGQIKGADMIVLLPDSETLNQAINVAQANQNRLPILAGDAFYTIDSLKQGGNALNGVVLPVPWHPLKSANPSFAQTGSSLWGGDVNWRTALSYDAMQALRAARLIGQVTPQMGGQGRAALDKALKASGFQAQGATGSISFLPSGDRNGQVVLVKVQPGKRSGTGFDFVPIQ